MLYCKVGQCMYYGSPKRREKERMGQKAYLNK